MPSERIFIKKNGGKPMIQIRIGFREISKFHVTVFDQNNKLIKNVKSSKLKNPDNPFALADSPEQLDLAIVTWFIRVDSTKKNSEDPYDINVEITQDGKRVKNGLFPYSGNLSEGSAVESESAFVIVE